jgi:hypothetical protein
MGSNGGIHGPYVDVFGSFVVVDEVHDDNNDLKCLKLNFFTK